MDQIINRVASSQIITFDLEQLYPVGDRVLIDIKDILFQGLILKEKDFRNYVKNHNWSQYANRYVAVSCSADAIIPTWAYMLISVFLQPFARAVVFGDLIALETQLFKQALDQVNWEQYRDAKVVVKGCSKVEVPVSAYVEVSNRLRPLAQSIMFGEACSTVPLFKRKE